MVAGSHGVQLGRTGSIGLGRVQEHLLLELIMFLIHWSDMRWQLHIGVRIPLSPPASPKSPIDSICFGKIRL